jgi:hypothetical protein
MRAKTKVANAKWASYNVQIECQGVERDAFHERLKALYDQRFTKNLLFRGDDGQCYTWLIVGFGWIERGVRFPFHGLDVTFGNCVKHLLGADLSPLGLIEAAERFAGTHTGLTVMDSREGQFVPASRASLARTSTVAN